MLGCRWLRTGSGVHQRASGVKVTLLKQLDTVLDEDCILGTNTSALPISEIARAVPHRADHILGVHFFNPAHIMKLVEITRTISTDQSVIDTVVDIMKGVDKHPIVVNEGAGFVVNRILIPEITRLSASMQTTLQAPV